MPEKPKLTFFSRTTFMGTRVPLGSSPQWEIRSFSTCLMATGKLLATRMPEYTKPKPPLPRSGPPWYCDSRGSFLPGASLVVCRSLQGAVRRWASELILDKSTQLPGCRRRDCLEELQ